MQPNNQSISRQYEILKMLVLDINKHLQNSEHYNLFDPIIKKAILEESDEQQSSSINAKALPQVKLIRDLRENFQIIANDLNSEDYTKFFKTLYHLRNFKKVLKAFLLAESTIHFSPEFISKMLAVISFLVQWQQIFYDELSTFSDKTQKVLQTPEKIYLNINTKRLHYYHDKLISLLNVLDKDSKIKPYIHNLERLVTFAINLKEKGMMRANTIGSILDLVKQFDNLTKTSIKQILQQYAVFTENEIKELLNELNDFWNSFFPVCDELEINSGLKMGYLTNHLEPVINFCNILEQEFNPYLNDSSYPFLNNRLQRVSSYINHTITCVGNERQKYNQLTLLDGFIDNYLETKQINLEKTLEAHQAIELLNCDESTKKNFHALIDEQIQAIPTEKLTQNQLETIEFNQLLTKYKLHQIDLPEAQALFAMLQDSNDENASKHYLDLANEYKNIDSNALSEKIEKGELPTNEINHLIVMIHLFEISAQQVTNKISLLNTSIDQQIRKLDNFQQLLNDLESGSLAEENFYQLLSFVDLLDCDESTKQKYKELMTDFDHKRKNGGYLTALSDFLYGFFVQVTVPFPIINKQIQEKIETLKRLRNIAPDAKSQTEEKPIDLVSEIAKPFSFVVKKVKWQKFKEQLTVNLADCKEHLDAFENLKSYQENRYQQLKTSLSAYKPHIYEPELVNVPLKDQKKSLKDYFNTFTKFITAKALSFVDYVYTTGKKIFSRIKSFFFPKEEVLPEIEIARNVEELPAPEPYPYKEIDSNLPLEYKQLSFIEERIFWLFTHLVDPKFHPDLKNALMKHQIIKLTDDMPYFYEQAAKLVNVFILFRKVLLSYSHKEMLELSLAIADLNAENKIIFDKIIKNTDLQNTSQFYRDVINPTLTNFYNVSMNLKVGTDIQTSLPTVLHNFRQSLELMSQGNDLDIKPLVSMVKRVGSNLKNCDKPFNKDVQNIYDSIDKLAEFLEKVANHNENLIIELIFSLKDLSEHFSQLSSSVTRLLIKDQFPYLSELGVMMTKFNTILSSLHNEINVLEKAGLHPVLLNSIRNTTILSEQASAQLTTFKIEQEKMLLKIEELKSFIPISTFPHFRGFKHELENMTSLLTNPADEKFIDKALFAKISARLNEIQEKTTYNSLHRLFGIFTKNHTATHQNTLVENEPTLVRSQNKSTFC